MNENMQKMQILDDIINEVEILEINKNNNDALLVSTVDNSIIENPSFYSPVEINLSSETPFFSNNNPKIKIPLKI